MKLRWLALSTLLHLAGFLLLCWQSPTREEPPVDIEIQYDDRVVDSSNSQNDKVGKFLGKKNQQVEKQTVAKQPPAPQEKNGQGAAAGSSEFVPGISEGDETLLSTREFKYYTYFARIREQLNQHWRPALRSQITILHLQGRDLPDEDLTTRLLITLDPIGKVTDIKIIDSSGITGLDEAAVESFQEIGMFPNPPKEMIEDGKIVIQWDFVVAAGSQPRRRQRGLHH